MTTARSRGTKLLRFVFNVLLATICGFSVGATAEMLLVTMLPGTGRVTRDFMVYWATGQELAHHVNPYDARSLLVLEHGLAVKPDEFATFMRNPPFALPLTYPLGFMSYQAASIVWSVLLMCALGASVYLVWVQHGKPKNRRHLIGYTFGPALVCLICGQVAILALLGLVLFLRWHRTRPFLAGMSLWLCILKPHLFVPFGLVLLLWIFFNRSYRLLAGTAFAVAASCGLTLLIDARAWPQYVEMVRTSGIDRDFILCPSFLLRYWISPRTVWISYVPVAIASVWAVRYYIQRRKSWDWIEHGSPLMLVSILTAPYSWLYDQALAIPAMLHGAFTTKSRALVVSLALLSSLIGIALFCNYWKSSAVYLWTLWASPAWLAWYFFATHHGRKSEVASSTRELQASIAAPDLQS